MKANKEKIEETMIEQPEVVEEVVEEVIERPYTLRKLKDGDLFPLLKIFRKVGMANFKEVLQKVASGKPMEEIGILVFLDIAETIIGHLDSAEEEIYSLWSDISGLAVDDIKEMEFGTLPLMIYDSFSEVKNTAFFKVLFKFVNHFLRLRFIDASNIKVRTRRRNRYSAKFH